MQVNNWTLATNPITRFLDRMASSRSKKLRRQQENQITKIPLQKKHIKNCNLILNREELIKLVPKGSAIAELGVDQGDFSDRLLKVIEPKELHLVDIWGSTRYDIEKYESVKSRFAKEIEEKCVSITRKDSIDAAAEFEESYFDWIYIDTDHSYSITKDELYTWSSKIAKNGVIAGHDYSLGNWPSGFRYGVIEAVHEFCVKENWELIHLTAEPIEGQSFAIRRMG